MDTSGFVVNTIVLWNWLCSQAALELIEGMGDDVLAEDAARLSLLKREWPARCCVVSKKRERPVKCNLVSKKWQHIQVLGGIATLVLLLFWCRLKESLSCAAHLLTPFVFINYP